MPSRKPTNRSANHASKGAGEPIAVPTAIETATKTVRPMDPSNGQIGGFACFLLPESCALPLPSITYGPLWIEEFAEGRNPPLSRPAHLIVFRPMSGRVSYELVFFAPARTPTRSRTESAPERRGL